MEAAHSSKSHSILQPLYLLRDLLHVRPTKFTYALHLHHAGSRKHGIVDRIGRYMGISVNEFNANDDKVVDVIQVFTDRFIRMPCTCGSNDDISCCTHSDLMGNMIRESKVSV